MRISIKSCTFAKQAERPSYDCQTADAERPLPLSDRASRCRTDIVADVKKSDSKAVGQQSGLSAQAVKQQT